MVLLDHGLYRRLDDAFRRDYCRLWQAIALSDEESIRYRCENMHAGAVYPLLVSMLTYRPWDEVVSDDADHLQRRQRPVDAVALRSYAHIYFQEIVELLGSVPSDLLLLFKTNDCLRHIDRTLGMPANSTTGLHPLFCFKNFLISVVITVVASVAADVILKEEVTDALTQCSGWTLLRKICSAAMNWARVRSRVLLIQWIQWTLRWQQAFNQLLG